MGTRSLTIVKDGRSTVLKMYRQMDGYPSGHGKELSEFLKDIKMVNGLGEDRTNIANGAGCLAAQLVAHFKKGPGDFYLLPVSSFDCGQEYEYHVRVDGAGIKIKVIEVGYGSQPAVKRFEGTVQKFGKFCEKEPE